MSSLPSTMGLFNVVSTPQISCNGAVEYELEEIDVETFQLVEFCTERDTCCVRIACAMRVYYTAQQGV
jgi:hypothetical protein